MLSHDQFGKLGKTTMKYTGLYLFGFVLFATGLCLALWKLGVLAIIGTFWTGVAILAVIGIGIMVAVMHSSAKRTVEVDHV